MANYVYDVTDEVFKREDNRGNHLAINIVEANKIVNLINLGYPKAKIMTKVVLSNPKATKSTMNSFIKNYKDGNIEIPADAPAPVHSFESFTDSDRISALEKRVTELEMIHSESTLDKVRKWLQF